MLLLVLLGLGVKSCRSAQREQAFKDYVRDTQALLQQSDRESDDFFGLLRDPGDQGAVDIQTRVSELSNEAEQLVDRASELDRPDQVEAAHRYLVDALALRRDGLRAIAEDLPTALGDQGRGEARTRIAAQMQAFLASDVVYLQRFFPRLASALEEEELGDEVKVPRSQFLPHLEWLSPTTVADRVGRISGGGGGGTDGPVAPGLHGTGLVAVQVKPSGTALAEGGAADIPASEDLSFDVQVQNQGDNDEQDVTVRIEISGAGDPIEIEDQIDAIAAGETQTVSIPLADTPPTGQPVTISVVIEPVPGEEKTDNNEAEYSAVFSEG